MEFRTYREEDYDAVCDFLIALNRADRTHINWNWARFEWMYEHPESDRSAYGAIGLWSDGGRIVGAAIYDMYFGEAFCGVLPGCGSLYPEILDYAYAALRDDAGLGIAICAGAAEEIAAAERRGFVRAEQTETVMRIELDRPLAAALPEGVSFSELDPAKDDGREIQWLFWQGFDHGADEAEFEKDYEKTVRAGLRIRRHFDPYLSMAARAAGGEAVAYCGVWYQNGTDYAYVEPVCTVPAWRRKGVGRAVVCEALNRARKRGAKRAYVISDQPFYEALGFQKDRHYTFFWKT